jgi:hypothetical protein
LFREQTSFIFVTLFSSCFSRSSPKVVRLSPTAMRYRLPLPLPSSSPVSSFFLAGRHGH